MLIPAERRTATFFDGVDVPGAATAVITPGRTVTYSELAARVDEVAQRLGGGRRLVLVVAANDLDCLVVYLAALSAGHALLLLPGDNRAAVTRLTEVYDPDVVVRGGVVRHRRDGSAHELHPDLALLLSTSGSTGSPKLVRLSHKNLSSNAHAIAQYLDIRPTDRAATTLPMSYCYGLSVINSHLSRGAALLLTDWSVVDPCFWRLFRAEGGTTLAGVPHTFDLLDRVGFTEMDLPALRYVTQAGGRLAPDRVQQFARLGARRGWDFFVMYGQTEATARMAYLPPDLAATHPTTIGVPVPGGALSLRSVDEHDDPAVGELVYSGPNVMLGYAVSKADLALGRTTQELATGDLARRTETGMFEVVGRRSRFVKISGVRIDLQHVERVCGDLGIPVCCAGHDDTLVVALADGHDPALLRRLVTSELGVPARAVQICPVDEIPRLPTGKPDYAAVSRLAAPIATIPVREPMPVSPGPADAATVGRLYAQLLGRPDVTDGESFVSLGGDSLSYVEMSIRLEDLLGSLPRDWHTTPIRDLVPRDRSPRRRPGHLIEASVALRALAIVLVVGTHASLFDVKGSAHVLVALAGYNFARFQLTDSPRRERVRHQLSSVARVAVPSIAWIALAYALTDRYGPENVILLNVVLGPDRWSTQWDFWFVEVLVLTLLALSMLFALPWIDRLQRQAPFAFVTAMLVVGLVWRYELTDLDLLHTKPVFWLFALGWAAAAATTFWHRVLVTAVTVAAVPGFFDEPRRDALILAGIAVLIWVPSVPCPAWLRRVTGILASASLYIYLTHWQVYPHLNDISPLLAAGASLLVGVAYWQLSTRLSVALPQHFRGRRTTPAERAHASDRVSAAPAARVTSGRWGTRSLTRISNAYRERRRS